EIVALKDFAEQLLEQVVVFVRAALPADAADIGACRAQLFGQQVVCLRPLDGDPLAVLLEQRLGQAMLGGDVVVAELALVARPLLIHVLVQAGVDALQGVQAIVYLDVAAVGAFRADGTLRMQVPGPCLEAIRAGEQRADRAEFDDVAAELALILRVREGSDLHIRAALEEAKLRVAADVLGETSAARAVDAAFAVEDDMIGERIGFWKVALLLDIAAEGRTVEERIILKWAFAAPVADRAVERVV